ncbi:MAG: ribosome recycling factor [Mariprofundaceae bacterium]|nr:ribosome recycling factor [Mariprofundaceae bacterium]
MSKELETRMEKSVQALRSELATIRTGRANAALLDHIRVSYYGSDVPLSQVGSISVPEARMLVITPWEKTLLGVIEKAILSSDLGLNPSNDGTVIRLMMPELNEERRRNLVKQARQMTEQARVAVRNIRRDANDKAKAAVKDEGLSEDEVKQRQTTIQKVTDRFIAEVDQVLQHKEDDILTI